MTLTAGTRLGPYEVLAPLGAGGMGEVYRARDTRLEREVAIKVLPAELASDAERLKRFEKEARSASALNHPNIVTIYDIGSEGGISYIAMERVEGATLRELLAGGRSADEEAASDRDADRGGSGQGARGGDRASGPEARERDGDEGRAGEDPGLRPGEADLDDVGQRGGLAASDDDGDDAGGGRRDGRLHVAGAGERGGAGLSVGPVLARVDPVRDGDGEEGVPEEDGHRHARGDPERGPGADRSHQPADARRRCAGSSSGAWRRTPTARYASTKDLARDLATVRDRLSEASSGEAPASAPRARAAPWKALGAAAVLAAVSLIAGKWLWKTPAAPQPSFQQLTFRRGFVNGARFSSDGHTIVYSARWDGEPPHIFLTRPEAPESQRLSLPDASLVALSSRGELAMIAGKIHQEHGWYFATGTLETAPLGGGTPREIAEDMRWADWSPDGKLMLIVRGSGALEFPAGKVLIRGAYMRPVLPRGRPNRIPAGLRPPCDGPFRPRARGGGPRCLSVAHTRRLRMESLGRRALVFDVSGGRPDAPCGESRRKAARAPSTTSRSRGGRHLEGGKGAGLAARPPAGDLVRHRG